MLELIQLNNKLSWYRLTNTYLRYKRVSCQLRIFRKKLNSKIGSLPQGCGSEKSSDWSESAQSPPTMK